MLILVELYEFTAAENVTHSLSVYPMSLLQQRTCFENGLLMMEIITLPEALFKQQNSFFLLLT